MAPKRIRSFDPEAFLYPAGIETTVVAYTQGQPISSQDGVCDTVM